MYIGHQTIQMVMLRLSEIGRGVGEGEKTLRELLKREERDTTRDIGFELGFETGVLLPERVRRMFLVRRKYIKTPDKTEFWH